MYHINLTNEKNIVNHFCLCYDLIVIIEYNRWKYIVLVLYTQIYNKVYCAVRIYFIDIITKKEEILMEKEKKLKFAELLKKRMQLSSANKEKIHTISTDDPQLIDVLENFNESKDYKMLKNLK